MNLIKVKDAAKILSICEKGVWRLLASGDLPRIKIGHSTRIPLDAVLAFATHGTARPDQTAST